MVDLCTLPWLFVLTEPCRDCLPTPPDLEMKGKETDGEWLWKHNLIVHSCKLCKIHGNIVNMFPQIKIMQEKDVSVLGLLMLISRQAAYTNTKKLDFHLEGCISDNWMRGSNSYLKRTRLVAPSKKVTITISPNQPLFTPWYCQCESASIDGILCLIFSQHWDFPWAKAHKGLFFLLSGCTGSLLAAHSQYPLN